MVWHFKFYCHLEVSCFMDNHGTCPILCNEYKPGNFVTDDARKTSDSKTLLVYFLVCFEFVLFFGLNTFFTCMGILHLTFKNE